MALIATGQLFYAGQNNKAGPLFSIEEVYGFKDDGEPQSTFSAVLMSTTGNLIERTTGFPSAADAFKWCEERAEY